MADIWDIAEHIEDNPEDYPQRWSLAKKLYSACEYDQALEHLVYLRQHWEPQINPRRYLAATYYRLGRYEDAASELREAVQSWPDEIALWEQLTRALEAGGAYAEALEVWEEILKRQAAHPMAKKAQARLKRKIAKEKKGYDSSGLAAKAQGFFANTSPCPQCGAANLEEVAQCWQCGKILREEVSEDPGLSDETPRIFYFSPETMGITAIGIVVLLLLLSGFLTLNLFGAFGRSADISVIHNLSELYMRQVPLSRLITGMALLAVWPCALWIGLAATHAFKKTPAMLVVLCGLLMGSIGYTASFLPPPMTILAVLLPLLASLIAILLTFGLSLQQALVTWGIHWVLVVFTGLSTFFIAESFQIKEGINALEEVQHMVKYSSHTGAYAQAGIAFPQDRLPIESYVIWRSTGSTWMDRRGGPVAFTILSESESAGLKFQIYDETGATVFDYVEARKYERLFEPVLGKKYRVALSGNKNETAHIIIEGLYPVEFIPVSGS